MLVFFPKSSMTAILAGAKFSMAAPSNGFAQIERSSINMQPKYK
jgi:hypothetical protein